MSGNPPNGFLIIFDGIDGVGKTTQLNLAETYLKKAGWQVVTRRNLGGTPIGEELGRVMKAKLPRPPATDLYISAAIQAALVEQIDMDKKARCLILMDRGPLSVAAYQISGRGLDEELGRPFVNTGISKLKPDLIIIYKADAGVALRRARQQSGAPDYFESKPLDFFERVAQSYEGAAGLYENIEYVDADQSVEAVHDETIRLINQTLAKPA